MVVAPRGEEGLVGRQRNGRQRSTLEEETANELGTEVLGVGRRSAEPWPAAAERGFSLDEIAAGLQDACVRTPHISLSTVTYLFEGEILHRHSLGSAPADPPR